jgi:putative peptidoglycan lipid II flippase
MGYGVGLLGLVAIKVLAPGFYASQDTRTPVIIAVCVLVITQLLNVVFVPVFAHAGLALSIGFGALINAVWLLIGLRRRGSYVPNKGWWRLGAQVSLACALLGAWLATMTFTLDWTEMQVTPFLRIGSMAGVLLVSALIYFVTLRMSGLNVINLLRR